MLEGTAGITGCPLYPGAALVNLSQSSATFVTADAFGNVLNWYEAQHRKKAELEVASDRGSVPGDVASYSLIMKHPDTSYLVTVYKLRGDPGLLSMPPISMSPMVNDSCLIEGETHDHGGTGAKTHRA